MEKGARFVKRISYAIDDITGLTWSRVGDEVAVPVMDYDGLDLKEEFTEYTLEIHTLADMAHHLNTLHWTKNIPLSLKNYHRSFWGMRPLKTRWIDQFTNPARQAS